MGLISELQQHFKVIAILRLQFHKIPPKRVAGDVILYFRAGCWGTRSLWWECCPPWGGILSLTLFWFADGKPTFSLFYDCFSIPYRQWILLGSSPSEEPSLALGKSLGPAQGAQVFAWVYLKGREKPPADIASAVCNWNSITPTWVSVCQKWRVKCFTYILETRN